MPSFRSTYSNPLKPDQQKALAAMLEWANKPGYGEFSLSGYAGTGKTFLMKHFNLQYRKPMVVTAPTHKAVRQVVKATGISGKTIQSLHGLRPNFNLEFNFKDLQFDTLGIPSLNAYSLIVIDESSMVTSSLKALNSIRAKQYGVKILYSGDNAQLPPINESISSVFSIPGYKLTEVIRQAEGNPLLKILAVAREDVFRNTDKIYDVLRKTPTAFNENGEGYITLDKRNFADTLVQYFGSNEFSNNVDFVRYASFSNDNILAWNNTMRNALLSNPSTLITEHDLLTGYTTIVDKFMTQTLTNSYDYMIRNITKRTTDDGFDVYSATLVDLDKKEQIVNLVDYKADNYGKFLHILNNLFLKATYARPHEHSKKWSEFYDFKNSFLTMIPIQLPEAKYPIPKDIDYGYGLTIHKLQGSTLENVFVNIPDIVRFSTGGLNPLRQRLLYTAISRASKRVVFLR